MATRSLSRAQFDGLIVIPSGADVGVTESGDSFQAHSAEPGWNGMPIISGPRDLRREIITLSADGTRWGPTFDAIEARDVVVLHSGRYDGAHIPAGATSVVLRRLPVPDPSKPWGYAVLARRLDEPKRLLPVVVAGRLVSIEVEQDVPVTVQYRPIRPLRVIQVMPASADLVRGTQTWGLKGVDLT